MTSYTFMPTEDLKQIMSELKAQLFAAKQTPPYPPEGYRYPFAKIKDLEDRINYIDQVIEQRSLPVAI